MKLQWKATSVDIYCNSKTLLFIFLIKIFKNLILTILFYIILFLLINMIFFVKLQGKTKSVDTYFKLKTVFFHFLLKIFEKLILTILSYINLFFFFINKQLESLVKLQIKTRSVDIYFSSKTVFFLFLLKILQKLIIIILFYINGFSY